MPRIMPEPRYFSIPSIELGAEVLRNRALNCWPCVRSLVHSPEAVIHSPAEMMAACPTTVTKSRWPRAFARRKQKPFSALWKETRSTIAAGEHPRRIAVNQKAQHRPRMIRSRTGPAIRPAHPAEVETVDHIDNESRQVLLG